MKIQEKMRKTDVGGEISECREYRQIPSHHPAFYLKYEKLKYWMYQEEGL